MEERAQVPDERELVTVYDTRMESEAQVVRGLLESAGIEVLLTGLDAPQNALPGVGGIVVRVEAASAEEARRIIEEQRVSGALSAEVDVPESSEPGTAP